MFGVGLPELIIILVIALLIFGPKGLPDAGRTVGRWIFEMRNSMKDLSDEVKGNLNINLEEIPYEISTHKPSAGEKKEDPASEKAREQGPDAGDGASGGASPKDTV